MELNVIGTRVYGFYASCGIHGSDGGDKVGISEWYGEDTGNPSDRIKTDFYQRHLGTDGLFENQQV